MTLEIITAFLAGALFVSVFRGNVTTATTHSPARWMREAARAGVTIKVKTTDIDGEWTLEFELYENLEELNKQAIKLRDSGKKVEAIKMIRARLDIGLKEAKDHVEAL